MMLCSFPFKSTVNCEQKELPENSSFRRENQRMNELNPRKVDHKVGKQEQTPRGKKPKFECLKGRKEKADYFVNLVFFEGL